MLIKVLDGMRSYRLEMISFTNRLSLHCLRRSSRLSGSKSYLPGPGASLVCSSFMRFRFRTTLLPKEGYSIFLSRLGLAELPVTCYLSGTVLVPLGDFV